MANAVVPVCRRCGGERFRQTGEVEVRVDVGRKVLEHHLHDDGSLSIRFGHADDSDAHSALEDALDAIEFPEFTCVRCGESEERLEDLVIRMPEAGIKVNLPDGRTRRADRVWIGHPDQPGCATGDHNLRIMLAFHDPDGISAEVFAFENVEVWEPNPDQLALEAA